MSFFKKLAEGGGFSLPFLIHMYSESENIYLINDTQNLTHDGNEYVASAFGYSPSDNGESSLEVAITDNAIINLFENNYNFQANVIGVLMETGEVQEIRNYRHKYAEATWNGTTAKISFQKDDRLSMTFPSLIFTTYNNRGNS